MIEKNLGNLERFIRLVMGLALALWTLQQPALNGVELFVAIVSLCLVLNGVFSRCYLWYILDINSNPRETVPPTGTVCN